MLCCILFCVIKGRFFIFPLSVVIFFGVNAFANPERVSKSELSRQLQLYQHLSTLDVNFTQTKNLKSIDTVLKSSGHLSLNQAKKTVVWQILKPSHLKVALGEAKIEIETGDGASKQVQSLNLKDAEGTSAQNLMALTGWLKLDAAWIEQNYSVVKISTRKYEFKPKSENKSPFDRLELTLSPQGHVQSLFLSEISKDTLKIEFGKPEIK